MADKRLIAPLRWVKKKFLPEEDEAVETRELRRWVQNVESMLLIPEWQTPTLLSSWVDYGSGYSPAGYYKDPWGRVHLRGLIKTGTATSGTVLFNLPTGYRPEFVCVFFTYEDFVAYQARVDISAAGDVSIIVGGNTALSLDGISFRAA